jgi:hypothetical protein
MRILKSAESAHIAHSSILELINFEYEPRKISIFLFREKK